MSTTFIPEVAEFLRSCVAVTQPSSRGIITSRVITSGLTSPTQSRQSCPSTAVKTSNPSRVRLTAMSCLMTSSSSTTSTRPSPCVTGVRLPGGAVITLADRARVLEKLLTGNLATALGERLVAGHPCASPHSSGDRATASGAVCAGSNPAGGAVQSDVFEYLL